VRAAAGSRIVIVSQAPGTKAHASGIPWDDASGDRLRAWLSVTKEALLDAGQFAIVPMGFCYPGKAPSGDAPPRAECAPLWHPRLLPLLTDVRLILLIGAYAQARYLGEERKETLTATVRAFADYAPRFVPLPHPSPRNAIWRAKNPWFEAECVPVLQSKVRTALVLP